MGQLQGIARFVFDDGKVEEFKRLSARCTEIVRTKDTGTLQYEVYFNDDESECIVLERYEDAAAAAQHAANIGPELMAAVAATGTVTGELLGVPSPELRANLAEGRVRLFTPWHPDEDR